MKRTLAIIAALGLTTAVSGCFLSSENEPAAGAKQVEPQTGPAWKIVLQNACNGVAADNCIAVHGFTVTADGKFKVGPAPGGQIIAGSLTNDQMKDLSEKVAEVSISPSSDPSTAGREVCQEINNEEGIQDTITLTRAGQEKVVAETKKAEICFQTANAEAAAALHDAIWTLAREYYTLPFPNPCTESISALNSLYNTVKTCSKDEDCAYVSDDFTVIPPSSNEYVVTDNCSLAKPLGVGNAGLVQAQRQALVNALTHATEQCGGALQVCDGFMSGNAAPRCVQNVCGIPAAEH